jgi:hypothetical protein
MATTASPVTDAPGGRGVTTSRFEGYPYLVTRIGHCALRHLAVVPADLPRQDLVELAIRQAEANQLDTCLCLGPADAIYISPGEEPRDASFLPTGMPITDRLVVAAPVRHGEELARRREALRQYVECNRGSGFIVGDGLEGGRPATGADAGRLSGAGAGGLSPGLRRCRHCGSARGEYLALRGEGNGDRTSRVIAVHCGCDNHNRCAGCGERLAAHRLSAYVWDEARSRVAYLAAYAGLSHRCRKVLAQGDDGKECGEGKAANPAPPKA